MNSPKLPVISAAVGFVVSFIAGIFSRAPFGIMLLRAFLSAVGVAGFAFLAFFLIRKFLPELADSGSRDTDADKDSPGANVDITVDEFPSENGEDVPTFHVAPPQTEEDPGLSANTGEGAPRDGTPAPEYGSLSDTRTAVPAEGQASADGNLNTLPDIGTLTDEGSGAEEMSEDSSDDLSSAPVSADGADGVDTLNMVKAIRTVLAKD